MWTFVFVFGVVGFGFCIVRLVLALRRLKPIVLRTDGSILQVWIEVLESGNLPLEDHWLLLQKMSPLLKTQVPPLIRKLRENGAPLLPTLRRLRQFADSQAQAQNEASIQVGQVRAQLYVSIALNAAFALATWFLVPEVQQCRNLFVVALFLVLFFAALAAVLVHLMIDRAMWQGLKKVDRPIISAALLAGERVLGKIETGLPPDVAWLDLLLELDHETPDLSYAWRKRGVLPKFHGRVTPRALRPIFSFGYELREGIDACILDGRAARDRIDRQFMGLRAIWWTAVQQSLKQLPTKALGALFLGVLPGSIALFVVAGIAILSGTDMGT